MIKLCIDPGHGGANRANRGPTGYVEADGNLKVSKMIKEELDTTCAFYTLLTRDADVTLNLRQRANIGADFGADVFISMHSDACNGKAKGSTAFYSVDLPNDRILASKFTNDIAKLFGTVDRGAHYRAADPKAPGSSGATVSNPEDHYAVIDQAQDRGIRHVFLIEMLFHDNPEEEAILKQDANLRKIAQALAAELCAFFGIKYIPTMPLNTMQDILTINRFLVNKGEPELSLDYWPSRAKAGGTCDGGNVAEVYRRFAAALAK